MSYVVKAIGRVVSPLKDADTAPRQADEDAPAAWLVFVPEMKDALKDLRVGDDIIVVTWLDRAQRDLLTVRPRRDPSRAPQGVFSTRSPHRPNPIGLHETRIAEIDGCRIGVEHLEALDGTPVIDLKPALKPLR